jgi:glutathione S-transferase
VQGALADYRVWVEAALDVLERHLVGNEFALGAEFSGADVMLGYTLLVARYMNVLGARHPAADSYLGRLLTRPAFRKALRS